MYSASSPRGPEHKPANAEVQLKLIKYYWQRRKAILEQEYRDLRSVVVELIRAQQHFSAPLQIPQEIEIETDDGPQSRVQIDDVDFDRLLTRLRDIRSEIIRCTDSLERPIIPDAMDSGFNAAILIAELEEIDANGK